MTDEIKEAKPAVNWTERHLLILKHYLPYVVIACLSGAVVQEYKTLQTLQKEMNEQLQHELDFTRESYRKSLEAYQFTIQQKANEKGDKN